VDAGPVLTNEAPGTGRNGILVEMVKGRLRYNINTRWISGVSTIETRREFRPGEWVHITLTNDGTRRAAGMKIYVNGEEQPVDVIRNTNSNTANRNQNTPMRVGYSKHAGNWQGQVDELRFYTTRTLSADEASLLAVRETPACDRASARERTHPGTAATAPAGVSRAGGNALLAHRQSPERGKGFDRLRRQPSDDDDHA
jgi:hypothetical protein